MSKQFFSVVIAAAAFASFANAQLSWTGGTSSAGYQQAVAYGGGVFVAVGPAPQFAVSSDGLNWTPTATNPSIWWTGVTYGNGTFVAVGTNGFATSSDGTNWSFTTPPNNTEWNGVAYGNGVFVTVAFDGISHSVATSADGVAWTVQTAAAANQWVSVTYGNGLFVAVAQSGSGNRVMTSPDGVTWTSRTSAANLNWAAVTYGNGLFVAVAQDGVTNSVMTSPDGITWTLRTAASSAQWFSVAYGSGLFVAVAQDGITNSVMTSPDGVTWTIGAAASSDQWQCITFGNGIFVAGSTSGVTMAAAPPTSATTYTFTGPSGGALNSGSNNFAVTPNGQYTGTITITPSGGGLSTATVLTFNASSAAQMFTITPTAVGPVTLTPSNNGSLSDASALMYSTPPGAPTLTSVTPGNHQISVSFTAPGSTGGSAITGYTATCGSNSGSGSTSPVLVSSLTNGTAYTCTIVATNANGNSAASSASSSVTPIAPATSYTLTGPSGGLLNAASTSFTVTPNGPYTGTITITPSGGGLSTAIVLTFSNSSTPQTFTITPTAVGPVTLTPSNNGSLPNASALTYSTPPAAPTVTSATPGNGQISVAFTPPASTGGSTITSYSATCGVSTIAGAASPIVVTSLTNGTAYSCTVQATNNNGISVASGASNPATPVAPANSYSFSGAAGGALNIASSNFTVTPNAAYTGTITITPSGGGLSMPVALTFNNSSAAQTFTITPTVVGPVTLTPSNSGSLSNASALTYGTPPAAPTVTSATPGNGQISVAFTPPASTGGSAITSYSATCSSTITAAASPIIVTGLTNGTAYTCTVQATNNNGISVASGASNSATPITPANTYTFSGPTGGALNIASSNFTVTPNAVYTGTITITPSGGGLSTPLSLTFNNSSAAQTFAITPTAVGPVTLTPSNSGSLTNPLTLTYGTPSAAPTVTSATPGNGQISVAFTPPASTGGSTITSYSATCGVSTIAGAASPIVVTDLSNGTAYTCTVKATNSNGTGVASVGSNSATPIAPANSYSLSGPTGGALNIASSNFTVTPNAAYTGTITVTLAGGGLSTSKVLSFSNSSVPQTFTLTPSAVGPVVLMPSNSGSLTNPPGITYATPPAPPFVMSVSPGDGQLSVAFLPNASGGSAIASFTASCLGSGPTVAVTGSASPITITGLTDGQPYACTVTATNAAGTSAPSNTSAAVSPLSPATGFTLSGPSGGVLNSASSSFTVTPNAAFAGTITITPSGAGLSAPQVLWFSNSSSPQTFTITPVAVGPVTLTATNSGQLLNPPAISYATPPAPPLIGFATAGDGSAALAFTPSTQTGGWPVTSYKAVCNPGNIVGTGFSTPLTVSGLANGTAYTCTVAGINAAGSSIASAATSSFVSGFPGAPQSVSAAPGTNQAIVTFSPPPAVAGEPVTGYKVVANPGGVSTTGANSPITIGGLTNGTAYTFSVSAVNGVGGGPAVVSNVVVPVGPPSAPLSVAAAAGNGQATVSFSPPSDIGGSAIVSYTVVSNPGGISARSLGSPIVVSGLANGTSYTFTVTAANGIGTGPASSSSNAATPVSRSANPLVLSNFALLPVGVAGVEYPRQIFVVTGGTPPYQLAVGAGLLPPGLVLIDSQLSGIPTSPGNFPFALTVTDSAGNASSAPASVLINPAKADLILSQGSVSFSIAAGSQAAPAPANIPVRSSDVQQRLSFTMAPSPVTPWLAITGNGTTPGEMSIGLAPPALGLAPGTYQSAVMVTCVPASPCAGMTKTLAVTLTVASALPAIGLTDSLLKFASVGSTSGISSQITTIQNTGGGSLTLNSASPADSWLSVSKLPNTVGSGAPASVTVSADSTGLAAGVYNSSVLFSSSAGPATLPVQLLVSAKPLIQLMPTGSQFDAGWGSSPGNSQGSFLVTAGGSLSIQWKASVLSGSPWLKVQTSQGSASAASPGTVRFSVDSTAVAGNPAQAYYGVIRLSSDDSANSSVDYEVVLNILAPQLPVQPEPNPAGLSFSSSAAGPQTVAVYAGSNTALPYQASAFTQDGASWLQVTPTMGSASSGAPGQSIVSVAPAGLAPGVYRGGINYAFSGQAVRTVSVLFIVGNSSGCNPNQLIAAQFGLTDNFQLPLGWPAEIAVDVMNGCGAPVSSAQVSASFSNGDESIPLNAVTASAGHYSGTWIPHSVSPQASITATAVSGNSLAGSMVVASTRTSGQITANNPPVLALNGIIPALSHLIGGPITPGAPLEIYGANLAVATLTPTGPSLPTQLGGTTVTIGGIPAPLLYVSPNQVNVLAPAGLATGTQYQVQVNVNGALSAAETIELVPATRL